MLKGLSHITLSFLLLFVTTGLAVSKHFCGELLISTSFFAEVDPCCDTEGCCHNETKLYQVDEDFSTPVLSHLPHPIGLDPFCSGFSQYNTLFPKETNALFLTERESPPLPKMQIILSLKQAYLL